MGKGLALDVGPGRDHELVPQVPEVVGLVESRGLGLQVQRLGLPGAAHDGRSTRRYARRAGTSKGPARHSLETAATGRWGGGEWVSGGTGVSRGRDKVAGHTVSDGWRLGTTEMGDPAYAEADGEFPDVAMRYAPPVKGYVFSHGSG